MTLSAKEQAKMLGKVVGEGCRGKTAFYQGSMDDQSTVHRFRSGRRLCVENRHYRRNAILSNLSARITWLIVEPLLPPEQGRLETIGWLELRQEVTR